MPFQSLTREEVRSLLRNIKDARDRCGFTIAYLHALRVSEMNTLTVADTEGGYLAVARLKGSMKTVQPLISLPEDAVLDEVTALRDVVRKHGLGPKDVLFPKSRQRYYEIFRAAGRAAGLSPALSHPHILKHSIAYHLADQSMPIKDLQTYCGHKNLSSTGVYLESTDAKASAVAYRILAGK